MAIRNTNKKLPTDRTGTGRLFCVRIRTTGDFEQDFMPVFWELEPGDNIPIDIQEKPPIHSSKINASYEFDFSGIYINKMRKIIGTDIYERSFTWSGLNISSISSWVKL